MKVRVIGMKRFDGKFEGKEYHQTTLHCAVLDEDREGLTGNRVKIIKVPDAICPVVLSVGAEYVVYFGEANSTGNAKVEFISEVPASKKAS